MDPDGITVIDDAEEKFELIREIIIKSKDQEDAFCLCDIGDLIHSHRNWLSKMPRVKPYYGKFLSEDFRLCYSSPKYHMYHINDGTFGSFSEVVPGGSTPIPRPLNKPANEDTHPSIIWGLACDSVDCVDPDCDTPELNIGNWLVWIDTGAYTKSVAGNFTFCSTRRETGCWIKWKITETSGAKDESDIFRFYNLICGYIARNYTYPRSSVSGNGSRSVLMELIEPSTS